MNALREEIEQLLQTTASRCGMVMANLETGARLEINPQLVFPAASMIKVPIMYEIIRQVAKRHVYLDSPYTVPAHIYTGGAGILRDLHPNITLTIQDLTTLMITLSDNTATNMLIDLVGMDAVNATIRKLGLKSTVLRRHMMDFDAAREGKENETCAADLCHLFEIIYHSSGLPQHFTMFMLDMLTRQQFRDKIPFFLPDNVVMAHKTGNLPGVEHDAGILLSPTPRYILCILLDHLPENYQGIQLIAQISKAVFTHFHGSE